MFNRKKDAKSAVKDTSSSSRQLRSSKPAVFFKLNDKEQPISITVGKDSPHTASGNTSYFPHDAHTATAPTPLITGTQTLPLIRNFDDDMAESMPIGPPTFDGSSAQNPQAWVDCLENFIAYKGLDDDKQLALFKLRLTHTAHNWLTALPANRQDTFAHLKAAFLERFQPRELEKFRFAKELFTQKQQPGQSVDSYVTDIQLKASFVGMDAKSQLWAALNGLLPHISSYVVERSPENLDDLLKYARIAELSRAGEKTDQTCISKQIDVLTQQMSVLMDKVVNKTTAAVREDKRDTNDRHVTFYDGRSRSPSPYFERRNKTPQRSLDSSRRFDETKHQPDDYRPTTYTRQNSTPRGYQTQFSNYRQPSAPAQTTPTRCGRCGNPAGHTNPQYCPMIGKACYNCQKLGHSRKMCRSKIRQY